MQPHLCGAACDLRGIKIGGFLCCPVTRAIKSRWVSTATYEALDEEPERKRVRHHESAKQEDGGGATRVFRALLAPLASEELTGTAELCAIIAKHAGRVEFDAVVCAVLQYQADGGLEDGGRVLIPAHPGVAAHLPRARTFPSYGL